MAAEPDALRYGRFEPDALRYGRLDPSLASEPEKIQAAGRIFTGDEA